MSTLSSASSLRCHCNLLVNTPDSARHCRCCNQPAMGNWRLTGEDPTTLNFFNEDQNLFLNPWEEEQLIWTQVTAVPDSSSSSSNPPVHPSPQTSSSQTRAHDAALGIVSTVLAEFFTSSDIIELILTYAEPPFSAIASHQELIGSKYLSTLVGGKQLQALEESGEGNGTTELEFARIPNHAAVLAWSGLCSSHYRCDAKFVFVTATSCGSSELPPIKASISFDLNSDCSFFQLLPTDLKWDSNSSKVIAVVLSDESAIDLHRLTVFYTIQRSRGFSQASINPKRMTSLLNTNNLIQ